MRHHRELFEMVRKRTGMHLPSETFHEVVGFVTGYDYACEGGTLCGFREWLLLRLRSGSNLGWCALVLGAAFPDSKNPEAELNAGSAAQRHAIDTLFGLIAEFDEARSKYDGLKKIFLEYDQWERDQRAELEKEMSEVSMDLAVWASKPFKLPEQLPQAGPWTRTLHRNGLLIRARGRSWYCQHNAQRMMHLTVPFCGKSR